MSQAPFACMEKQAVVRLTQAEYDALLQRKTDQRSANKEPAPLPAPTQHDPLAGMNKTERLYSQLLDARMANGEILSWAFEAIKFRLAKRTWYTPDFEVTTPTHFEYHEVKGFWQDDARVKFKVVAEAYPDRIFIAVQRKKGEWIYERISER